MKKEQIQVIEKSKTFNLSFQLPIAQLKDEELALLYGGSAEPGCPCRRGTLACDCFGGGVLKEP